MRIGVVSDTHGHLGSTTTAVGLLKQAGVSAVLHCGDIGSAAIVPLFSPWPTHFVFGNVDDDEESLVEAIRAAGQTCHGRFGNLTLGDRKIAFLHSDDVERFTDTIASGTYDLVCYGHTHAAEQHREGNTLVLNPGALYRASPRMIALVDLPELHIEHVTVR
jgi:uncharacterized protein